MKKIILAASVVALSAVSASAADLAARSYVKAPAPVESVYNWTGFYIGGSAGYSWNKLTTTDLDYWDGLGDTSQQSHGAAVGGTVGYNWQVRHLVYGIEGDFNWLSNSSTSNNDLSSVNGLPYDRITGKIDSLATVRGRIGIALDPALLYMTGGLAFGHVKNSYVDVANTSNSLVCPGCTTWSDSGWRTGFVFGGGVESGISSNLSLKVEALYYQLSDHTVSDVPRLNNPYAYRQRFDDSGLIARVGLNYRFGGPVVAAY